MCVSLPVVSRDSFDEGLLSFRVDGADDGRDVGTGGGGRLR
jgi:hypothetical protein